MRASPPRTTANSSTACSRARCGMPRRRTGRKSTARKPRASSNSTSPRKNSPAATGSMCSSRTAMPSATSVLHHRERRSCRRHPHHRRQRQQSAVLVQPRSQQGRRRRVHAARRRGFSEGIVSHALSSPSPSPRSYGERVGVRGSIHGDGERATRGESPSPGASRRVLPARGERRRLPNPPARSPCSCPSASERARRN